MREILFRGKRVDNGEWVYGLLWKKKYDTQKFFIHYFPDKDDNDDYAVVKSKTVGQFTGLIANGKKIFKGDIATYVEDGLRGDFSQGVMEIVWNEKTAGFCGRTTQGRLVEITHLKNVIGNIHDNPELLEVG